jgi:glutaredoxin 3
VGDGVGEAEDAAVVGDDDDGAVGVECGGGEEFHDGFAGGVIEGGGGLVADDEAGLVHEGAGEGDALLLAAGELGREGVEAGAEAELVEEGLGAVHGGGAFHAGGEEGHGGVFGGGEGGEQVVLLEDEAEVAATEEHALGGREPVDVLAEEFDAAGGVMMTASVASTADETNKTNHKKHPPMKASATFYHAGCPVCLEAESAVVNYLDRAKVDLEIVHLDEAKGRVAEAEKAGVKSVPALVIDGQALHLNFGADIAVLR